MKKKTREQMMEAFSKKIVKAATKERDGHPVKGDNVKGQLRAIGHKDPEYFMK